MGGPRPSGWPLAKALELLGEGRHVGLVLESEQEESAARCFYVAAEKRLTRLRRLIPSRELDLEAAAKAGALRVAARPRDPEKLARLLGEISEEAREARTALRVVLDMQDGERSAEGLAARERVLAQAVASGRFLLLCVYDRRRFEPRALLAALYGHPLVIYDGLLCPNFHYRPPEDLLRPERELAWLLKNICDRERLISETRQAAGLPAVSTGPLPGGCQDCLHRMAALEEVRRQLRQMEAAGALAGQVGAEFGNRLTVIMGYAEMLLRAPEGSDTLREYAAQILRAARQAAALTERLQAFSRRQRVYPERLDLNQIVGRLLAGWQQAAGARLRLEFQPAAELWPVNADPGLLEQALEDVLRVARSPLAAGSTITLRTENAKLAAPPGELSPGRYVLLRLSHDGPSLEEDARRRLFEPVLTFREGELAPALWGADYILRVHGGALLAESPPEGGAQFTLYLPAQETAQSGPAGKLE